MIDVNKINGKLGAFDQDKLEQVSLGDFNNDRKPEMAAEPGNTSVWNYESQHRYLRLSATIAITADTFAELSVIVNPRLPLEFYWITTCSGCCQTILCCIRISSVSSFCQEKIVLVKKTKNINENFKSNFLLFYYQQSW